MTNERETFFQPLTMVDYDIAGNSFRAYYDADKKLVFVIDFLTSDIKPNVLLVINPVGDRKWDDILENDYGVDLETVRPKKDNKYQKLDIEYAGLSEYDELIAAYESGNNLNQKLDALTEFRHVAATRAAIERLGAAELTVKRSRETIDKTDVKIQDLQEKLKKLRLKLSDARQSIGKEPTKQSASKILRIESQIDSTNDKIKRAKKRLNNAQNRLSAAEDEIEVAQYILNKLKVNLPAEPVPAQIVVSEPAPVPVVNDDIIYEETKADDMDDDVKPLFDTDPKILDEEIAFKPINFGTDSTTIVSSGSQPVNNTFTEDVNDDTDDDSEETMPVVSVPMGGYSENTEYEEDDDEDEQKQENIVQPLSFTPPVSFEPVAEESDTEIENEENTTKPMLDGFTPIPFGSEHEELNVWEEPVIDMPTVYPMNENASEKQESTEQNVMPVPEYVSEPVVADTNDVDVAPVTSSLRPVSPISGGADVAPVVAVAPVAGGNKKPTMLYYVLLIVLIVLSVFTLWVYQNSANDVMPELGVKTETAAVVSEDVVTDVAPVAVPDVVDEEVVVTEDIAEEVVPETTDVVVPDVEPTPVEVTEPVVENVVVDATIVPVTQEKTENTDTDVAEQADVISPFINLSADTIFRNVPDAPEPEPTKIPTEEEILASKPAYGVSQNENMFVAAPEYETETDVVVTEEIAPVVEQQVTSETFEEVVEFTEPDIISEEVVTEEEMCADGNAPDSNGCCSGEEFVLFPDGERACCIAGTDECFPPL